MFAVVDSDGADFSGKEFRKIFVYLTDKGVDVFFRAADNSRRESGQVGSG